MNFILWTYDNNFRGENKLCPLCFTRHGWDGCRIEHRDVFHIWPSNALDILIVTNVCIFLFVCFFFCFFFFFLNFSLFCNFFCFFFFFVNFSWDCHFLCWLLGLVDKACVSGAAAVEFRKVARAQLELCVLVSAECMTHLRDLVPHLPADWFYTSGATLVLHWR